jgi:hypothetical protein
VQRLQGFGLLSGGANCAQTRGFTHFPAPRD